MFGGSGFGQPQQPAFGQQPTQQQPAFGQQPNQQPPQQPSMFGGSGAFGGASSFGQPQTGFGAPANTGFGAAPQPGFGTSTGRVICSS